MWQLFEAYCKEVKANPILVDDWVGGAGKKVTRKKERPVTNEGFSLYCWKQGIMADVKDYFSNREGRYEDFVPICSRIREAIREDQIGGGMAGIYNPSITQRLNGLVEKTENKHEVSEIKISHDR